MHIATLRPADASFPRAKLLMLAAGTFAIGTEGFMIAPLLPAIAQDLNRSLVDAGQLVAGFTLTYGLSSPLLTAAASRMDRRRLLLLSLVLFLLGNLICIWADGFGMLMAARIMMGAAAGLYMPNANAVGSGLVAAPWRGRALATVAGGQSLAIAVGVPLAAVLGDHAGWRATFVAVSALTVIAIVGVARGLPAQPAPAVVPGWRERLAPLRQPALVATLAVTVLWAAGAYTMLTYLAAYLGSTLGVTGAAIGAFMAVWGVSAAVGVFAGGAANDRLGAPTVLVATLAMLALAFVGLWATAQLAHVSPTLRLAAVLVAIVAWGLAVWGFFPAQQARLIALGGSSAAPLVLSLNASGMYIGFAAGASLGGGVLSRWNAGALGLAAAACEGLALLVLLATLAGQRVAAH
jgi:predicted MFS family arabinose efflux permease